MPRRHDAGQILDNLETLTFRLDRMKKPNTPIPVRAGKLEFLKLNAEGWEWRDAYHWILSLSWPRFAALVFGAYVALNIAFALAYCLGGNAIAEMPRGSFPEAFFFSIETLSTVGFGHMYPNTAYGHVVTSLEIMVGMFWMAMMTGVIFVRFSRPTARIVFTNSMVIAPFNGRPTLMLRVANLRSNSMVEAEFRVTFIRNETTTEGETGRRFYPLKLMFERLIMFPVALTLRHVIDETSPLHGATADDLRRCEALFMASIVCVDTVIPAPVQSQQDYSWEDVHFGRRFVEIYTDLDDGRLAVDYGRLPETEPAPLS
jgi:inward rectifier potassium channel